MVTSEKGLALIKSFEGCRLESYQDPVGIWTIGYGHTKGVTEGMKITQTEADDLLKGDLLVAEKSVSKQTYEWNQNQFDALVSFTFNCGAGNLSKLTQSGKRTIPEISEKLLSYNKAKGKVLAGLTRRRKAEKELFDSPIGTEVTKYYPAYTEPAGHLDVILKTIGVPDQYIGNYVKRRPLAEANGIRNYNGTTRQNLDLIAKARAGKLVKV